MKVTPAETPPTSSSDPPRRVWWPEAAACLLIITELSWVIPWYLLVIPISHIASPGRAVIVLGGIMLSGYFFTRFAEDLRLIKKVTSAGLAFLLFAGLVLSAGLLLEDGLWTVLIRLVKLDPGAILVVFAVTWLWWRGMSLAQETVRPWKAWRRFEVGILVFVAYLLVANQFPENRVGMGWLIVFLFSGFSAVICARISYIQVQKGVARNPFDRRWTLSIAGALGGTLFLTSLAAGLITGQYRRVLDGLADLTRYALAAGIFILSIPGMFVAFFLERWGGVIRQWLADMRLRFQVPTPPPSFLEETYIPPEAISQNYSPLPGFVLSILFWLIVLALVALAINRLRSRLAQNRDQDLDGPESVLGPGDLRKVMRQLVQDALDSLGRRLRPAQRYLAAARIRRIYAQLMDLSSDLNVPRPAAKTPLEFLPDLQSLFLVLAPELAEITHAYMRVRYGEFPETDEELLAVELAWQRVAQEGKRLLSERRQRLSMSRDSAP